MKEYGIGSIVFDPCGNTPAKGDYISVMEQNFHNLQMAFSTQREVDFKLYWLKGQLFSIFKVR